MRISGHQRGTCPSMMWLRFSSWSISTHLLVWSLLPVLVCALALAVGRSAYDRIETTAVLTTSSRVTLAASTELLQAILDLETGVRGYALIADPDILEPFETGQPHVAARLAQLREL